VLDKLTDLLTKAGKKAAKGAVQAYLESQEHNFSVKSILLWDSPT